MFKKILMLVFAVLLISNAASATAAPARGPPLAGDARGLIHENVLLGLPFLNHTAPDLRLQRAKTASSGGIELAIRVLNTTEGGIDRSKLTEGQKAELRSQIKSNVTWFEAKERAVQSSKDLAGVRQNAKEAADRWKAVYAGLKKEVGSMTCDNLDATLKSARQASTVAAGKIASLKAQGKDTRSLEKALANYDGHVDSATKAAANARMEFNSIGDTNDGHYAAGNRQIGAAQGELKSAYNDLKNVYRLVHGNGVNIP